MTKQLKMIPTVEAILFLIGLYVLIAVMANVKCFFLYPVDGCQIFPSEQQMFLQFSRFIALSIKTKKIMRNGHQNPRAQGNIFQWLI